MPRPRQVTQDAWYDIWAEWPAADRAAAIKVLEATHRQICKVEAKLPPYTIKITTGPDYVGGPEAREIIAINDDSPAQLPISHPTDCKCPACMEPF